MSKTFSSSYANVTISDPTYNPVSITTSGTITGTATALYSDLAALTITNSGKVAGGTHGLPRGSTDSKSPTAGAGRTVMPLYRRHCSSG
jgi:hypothetical protein